MKQFIECEGKMRLFINYIVICIMLVIIIYYLHSNSKNDLCFPIPVIISGSLGLS